MHEILRLLRDIEAEVNYHMFVALKMAAKKKKTTKVEKNKPRPKNIIRKTIR